MTRSPSMTRFLMLGAAALGFAAAAGCDTRDADMYYQAKRQPYHASEFFEDGMSARPLVPGTVARTKDKLGGAVYYKNAQPGYVELADPATAADTGFPADF